MSFKCSVGSVTEFVTVDVFHWIAFQSVMWNTKRLQMQHKTKGCPREEVIRLYYNILKHSFVTCVLRSVNHPFCIIWYQNSSLNAPLRDTIVSKWNFQRLLGHLNAGIRLYLKRFRHKNCVFKGPKIVCIDVYLYIIKVWRFPNDQQCKHGDSVHRFGDGLWYYPHDLASSKMDTIPSKRWIVTPFSHRNPPDKTSLNSNCVQTYHKTPDSYTSFCWK